jgi:hypothetical protein
LGAGIWCNWITRLVSGTLIDEFRIDFWERKEEFDRPYDITINERRGVVVGGCDCEDTMADEVVLKVYKKLGEYIIEKGLDT